MPYRVRVSIALSPSFSLHSCLPRAVENLIDQAQVLVLSEPHLAVKMIWDGSRTMTVNGATKNIQGAIQIVLSQIPLETQLLGVGAILQTAQDYQQTRHQKPSDPHIRRQVTP